MLQILLLILRLAYDRIFHLFHQLRRGRLRLEGRLVCHGCFDFRLYFEGAGCDIVEKKETLRIQSFYIISPKSDVRLRRVITPEGNTSDIIMIPTGLIILLSYKNAAEFESEERVDAAIKASGDQETAVLFHSLTG